MKERSFLLVIGNKEITRLTGTKQAQLIASDKGYTVKSVLSSNTFIIKHGNKYTKAKYVLDLVENPLRLEVICDSLPLNSIWNVSSAVDIKEKFYLGDSQLKIVEQELKLLRTSNGYARIRHEDILRVVCYMNSIKACRDFHTRMDTYPPVVKTWALNNFKGDCREIGLYCLLDCYEKGNLSFFLESWKKLILDEIDINGLVEHLKTVFLEKDYKASLLDYLHNLKGC